MTKPEQWKDRFVPEQPTPSMDDKKTPSPPVRTNEEFHADQKAGVNRIGKATGIRGN